MMALHIVIIILLIPLRSRDNAFIHNLLQDDCNDSLFPIYDITLGKTTISEITKLGYKRNPYLHNNSNICCVNGMVHWDSEKKGVIVKMLLGKDNSMPEKWKSDFDFD